jgi:DNA polymerase-1
VIAKVINFGILYGMGVNALKQNLGGTREEAQMFYNEYFKTFTTLAAYLEKVKAETAKNGYTETFFGRRRYFEGIKSRLPYIKAQAERMAINAPIQGTEADLIKLAMIQVDAYIKEKKLDKDVYPLLQVHDSLIYEVKDKFVDGLLEEIKNIMQNILTRKETKDVPIMVHKAVGEDWGSMKDF